MWQRLVLGLIAALLAGNGAHMLFAPEHWYHSIESVEHTGPLNPHFVRDIGAAYFAAAVGLALGAWRPRWLIPAALSAVTFLTIHAAIHLWESLFGHTAAAAHAGVIDSIGVYGPPLLALLVVAAAARTTQEA
jgi:DoxX-like family